MQIRRTTNARLLVEHRGRVQEDIQRRLAAIEVGEPRGGFRGVLRQGRSGHRSDIGVSFGGSKERFVGLFLGLDQGRQLLPAAGGQPDHGVVTKHLPRGANRLGPNKLLDRLTSEIGRTLDQLAIRRTNPETNLLLGCRHANAHETAFRIFTDPTQIHCTPPLSPSQ